MDGIYSQWLTVPETTIGDFDHVDHIVYTQWLRDVTVAHYGSLGINNDLFKSLDQCFVVRRRKIEHLAPCFLDDRLLFVTWISELGNKAVKRQHRILKRGRKDSLVTVVRAVNLSIFVDRAISAVAIPDSIRSQMTVLTERDFETFKHSLDIADF